MAPVIPKYGKEILLKALQHQENEMNKLLKSKMLYSPDKMEEKQEQRNECARNIRNLYRFFAETISSSVFATSIAVMEHAIMKVNISWKYLSCFSAACFSIGLKWVEDLSDDQPTMSSLALYHAKQWRLADLKRMECKVLNLLQWEVPRCTYLSFLPVMQKMIQDCGVSLSPNFDVTRKAEFYLLQEFSFVKQYQPAVVALGVLAHCIQQSHPSMKKFFDATTTSASHTTEDYSNVDTAALTTVEALMDIVMVSQSELSEISQLAYKDNNNSRCRTVRRSSQVFRKVHTRPAEQFRLDPKLSQIEE